MGNDPNSIGTKEIYPKVPFSFFLFFLFFFLVCFVECPHILLRGGGGQTFFRLYKYTANVHESGTNARCVAARRTVRLLLLLPTKQKIKNKN